MDLGLSDAAVCVQGGSRGIGRAAAECFAAEGARVVVLGREQRALDDTADALRRLGSPDSFAISVDVADGRQIEAAFGDIRARWGQLNALICAAGPPVSHQAWDTVTDAQFVDAFVVGALSAVRCARSALPMLRAAQWARIVNISAMSSRCQGRGLVDYSAAKSALTSITKNLSLELGAEGILANAVSPGAVMSDQLTRELTAVPAEYGVVADDPKSVMRYISEKFGVRSDLGRVGLPGEIGAVICFLASHRNSYMTGANINVDSGSAFFA